MLKKYRTPDEEPNPGYYTSEQEEQDELDDYEQVKEDLAMEEG